MSIMIEVRPGDRRCIAAVGRLTDANAGQHFSSPCSGSPAADRCTTKLCLAAGNAWDHNTFLCEECLFVVKGYCTMLFCLERWRRNTS